MKTYGSAWAAGHTNGDQIEKWTTDEATIESIAVDEAEEFAVDTGQEGDRNVIEGYHDGFVDDQLHHEGRGCEPVTFSAQEMTQIDETVSRARAAVGAGKPAGMVTDSASKLRRAISGGVALPYRAEVAAEIANRLESYHRSLYR